MGEIVKFAKVGITTEEIDNLARKLIKEAGGEPAFLGYKVPGSPPFPSALCLSINQEVVHAPAVPARALKEGDVVGLDIGMKYPANAAISYQLPASSLPKAGSRRPEAGKKPSGLFTDMAVTIGIGKVSREAENLMKVTRESLFQGLKVIRPGNTIGDIGREIENYVYKFKIEPESHVALPTKSRIHRFDRVSATRSGLDKIGTAAEVRAQSKYGIVRDLVGHGVGYEVHEEPPIPNYFDSRMPKIEIQEGTVLAIEPMITLGSDEVKVLPDKWTVVTRDGSLAAHFEVTIVVTKKGYEIATPLP